MRKVLVFQHVAHKILGTLNPSLKDHGMRMRYINFERDPDANPSVEKYNGLIILGGHMGVYEADKYLHIKTEMKLVEDALKKDIPVLGICFGAQLLAHVLGSPVRKHTQKEVGWCDINLTDAGLTDPLFSHFQRTEKIFQLHGDTFDIPQTATHLAQSSLCPAQAFRYGNKVYGLQFHLEADAPMIHRWMDNPRNQVELFNSDHRSMDEIRNDTQKHINHAMSLAQSTFHEFIGLFNLKERPTLLGSGHGKPTKKRES